MMDNLQNFFSSSAQNAQSTFTSLPWVIGILLIIAILVILITLFMVYRSSRSKADESISEALQDIPVETKLPPYIGWISEILSRRGYVKVSPLSLYFLKFLDFLRKQIDYEDYKYRLPWYLVVGPTNGGKTSLLESLKVDYPFGRPDFSDLHAHPECRWHITGRGVLMDIRGDVFLKDNEPETDEKNWRALLVLLSRYRSARPLNGIILTLPATELYGKNKLSQEQMGDRARLMASKLMMAQQSLGVKLPVYVMITKTDIVPGFRNFCSEIPSSSQQNMLGWSNPYNLEALYRPQWIHEAFSGIHHHLNQIRLEILAQGRGNEARDGVFVFPTEMNALRDPLSCYLNQIFKGDSFSEPLLLRGIYFSGDSGATHLARLDEEENNQTASYSTDEQASTFENILSQQHINKQAIPRNIFFSSEPFTEKIFLEYGLANPLRRRLLTINRGLNTAKIGTAAFIFLGTYGLLNSYGHFKQNRDLLTPMLAQMNIILQELNQKKIHNTHQTSATFDLHARQLMMLMDRLQRTSFFSVFVPPSWFSKIPHKLNSALKVAYQQIIIRTIYIDLLLKSRDLLHLRPSPKDVSMSIGQLLQPLTSQEFLLVRRYVDNIDKLRGKIEKFNALKKAADPTDLNELVEFTFQTRLPKEFIDQYGAFRSFLKDVPFPAIDLKPYTLLARETLNVLFQNFLNAIFTVTQPQSLPARMNLFLTQLNQKDKTSVNLDWLRKFSLDLAQAKLNLGEPGKTWMDTAIFQPGKEFDALFDKIDASPFFGKDVSQFLVDQAAIGFRNLQMQLQVMNQVLSDFPADVRKSLTDNRGQPIPFSRGVVTLEKALSSLFEEPYMAIPTAYAFTTQIPPGKMLYWDGKLIQVAYDMAKRFEDFTHKNASGLPPALHENLMLIARQSLQLNVVSLMGRAQNFVEYRPDLGNAASAEEILRTKIKEARESAPQLIKLLEVLNEGSIGYAFVELRNLLLQSNTWLLERVEQLIDSTAPYAIRDLSFSWWDGKPGLSYASYGSKDAEDLRVYLALQRQYMGNLALEFAKPIVAFLTSKVMLDAPSDPKLLNKWRRIIEQMESYQKKQPNNSLALLEDFISVYMSTCEAKTCLKDISVDETKKESGDFFLEMLRKMKVALLRRAEVLRRQTSIESYKTLSSYYNKYLRGQFPFTSDQAGDETPDVEPYRIREFFQKFDQLGGSASVILDQVHQLGESALESYQFLKMMEVMRTFFSSFVGQKAINDLPTFDVGVDFRVNKSTSKGDEFIVDWGLRSVGSGKVGNHDKDKKLTWVYGQPIEVSFRWADGETMPAAPQEDKNQRSLFVEGRTAIFKYKGPWSLLWLLKKHGASKMENKDSKAYTLKFSIPTGKGRQALVYDQVTLLKPSSTPKKPGKVLHVPDFPLAAPVMGEEVLRFANQPVLTDGIVARADLERHPEISSMQKKSDKKDSKKDDSEKSATSETGDQKSKNDADEDDDA